MAKNQTRLTFFIVVPSLILFISTNLAFYWIRLAGFSLLITGTIELLAFIVFAISTINLLIKLIRFIEWRNTRGYTLLVYSIVFLLGYFSSIFIIDSEKFLSSVEYRACYEGTMNTSRLVFREDGTFEDINIGFFAHVRYINGTWVQKNDTLELKYENDRLEMLGDNIVFKNDKIYTVKEDSLIDSWYYSGLCKGLN